MRRMVKKWGKALWTQLPGARVDREPKPKPSFASRMRAKQPKEYLRAKRAFFRDHQAKHGGYLSSSGTSLNSVCEVCHKRHPLSVHHTRGRTGALRDTKEFFLAVCFKCHRWIHDNPEEARKRGWIAKAGDWGRQPTTNQKEQNGVIRNLDGAEGQGDHRPLC